jgi:hypothetical protein
MAASTSTEFPAFDVPAPEAGLGFVTWNGDELGGNQHIGRPVALADNVQRSVDFKSYVGGLVGGPLILYGGPDGGGSRDHPPAVVLGPSNEFDVLRLMHVGDRIVAGAQGMISELPSNYTMRVLLSGRDGINAAMNTWGRTLQRAHKSRKIPLDRDKLSRQLHYVNDNGANYCYCHWYPACKNTKVGCIPMHETLAALKAYHKELGLHVGHYHLVSVLSGGRTHTCTLE